MEVLNIYRHTRQKQILQLIIPEISILYIYGEAYTVSTDVSYTETWNSSTDGVFLYSGTFTIDGTDYNFPYSGTLEVNDSK
jgi:hypothetical protein